MFSAKTCGMSEGFGGLVIDAVIQLFISKSVGNPGKVDDGVAPLQQWLPVKWLG